MGMSIGGSKSKRGRAAPEMNVTPLVDVVLVLLIIFMVITPLLTKQFWVHLPDLKDEPKKQENPKPPLVVTVDAKGVIHINRESVQDAELVTRLHRALAARHDRTVFFDAHDEAPFGRAATALDLARAAGASTIAVATDSILPGQAAAALR